jgi:hypothetical protein
MELPADILNIIRDYSKPVTRPDWRTVQPLSGHTLYTELYTSLMFETTNRGLYIKPLYRRVFNHLKTTEWGEIYMFVRMWGIMEASCYLNLRVQEVYEMPGMLHAQDYYDETY